MLERNPERAEASKYKTYLDQLGIKYPTVRDSTKIVPQVRAHAFR